MISEEGLQALLASFHGIFFFFIFLYIKLYLAQPAEPALVLEAPANSTFSPAVLQGIENVHNRDLLERVRVLRRDQDIVVSHEQLCEEAPVPRSLRQEPFNEPKDGIFIYLYY